ncbi:MAG: T9SS type A sorting domain-containing protein, partial [Flammeovirgaceae bacterium]
YILSLNFLDYDEERNAAIITGDIHMTFVGDLPYKLSDYSGWTGKGSVAVEFVTPSVTSANLDELIGIPDELIRWLVYVFNPHMKKVNLDEQGYFVLDVQNNRVQADWYYIETIKRITDEQWFNHGYYVREGKRNLQKAASAAQDQRTRVAMAPLMSKELPLKAYQALVVLGNYPNPAQHQAILHLGLLEEAKLKIEIFDINGQLKQTVLNENQEIGMYQIQFDTQALANGLYFIKVSNGKQVVTKKMVIKK